MMSNTSEKSVPIMYWLKKYFKRITLFVDIFNTFKRLFLPWYSYINRLCLYAFTINKRANKQKKFKLKNCAKSLMKLASSDRTMPFHSDGFKKLLIFFVTFPIWQYLLFFVTFLTLSGHSFHLVFRWSRNSNPHPMNLNQIARPPSSPQKRGALATC